MPAHAVIGGRTKTSCGTIDLRGLAEGINARRESFASISLFGQLGADLVEAGCTSPLIPPVDDAGISAMGVPGTVVVSCVN